MAKQAWGSVCVRLGDTVVLVTASGTEEARDIDFTPLLVDYEERFYAAGKIPGGFIKREGRPRTDAILSARLIDRSIRPLFHELYRNDTHVVSTVLSVDESNPPDVISINGASLALGISQIPFAGPLGACRVGMVNSEYILNPSLDQLEESVLDIVVAGTEQGITMIESGAREAGEEEVYGGLEFAYRHILKIIEAQRTIIAEWGLPKLKVVLPPHLEDIRSFIREKYEERIKEAVAISGKSDRMVELRMLEQAARQEAEEHFDIMTAFAPSWENLVKEKVRELISEAGRRQDGRLPNEIRDISCEVGIFPRTHGSALFTRGQTQALAITTLGASSEEQRVDGLQDEEAKRFMLHYNFPPFSVGEVRPMRGPGRREIGHGALAERALEIFLPPEKEFPYTVRVVSEILESNGSSSMATVCGSSLSLMDAGVPVLSSCAGLSIGLIKDGNRNILLMDILGSEDHYGEMDFKVAGSRKGITAIQLDVKNQGLEVALFRDALAQAHEGRLYILDVMDTVIEKPRGTLSTFAPKIGILEINPERIGAVIGPGGKVIKKIVEETGADIDIQDDGRIVIFSRSSDGKEKAMQMIRNITQEVEIGKVYLGKVVRITDFGAFVEIFPGKDGLCHISQFSRERIRRVEDVVKVGDDLLVKVIGVDGMGKVSLSHKDAVAETEGSGHVQTPEHRDRVRTRSSSRRGR